MSICLNEARVCNIFSSNIFFFPKSPRLLGSSLNFVSVWSTCFFCEYALERVLGFFFLQLQVADGFHAPIFVIRAVLKCDLSTLCVCVFFGK